MQGVEWETEQLAPQSRGWKFITKLGAPTNTCHRVLMRVETGALLGFAVFPLAEKVQALGSERDPASEE